jgi:hypothetical protein
MPKKQKENLKFEIGCWIQCELVKGAGRVI